LLLVLLLLLPLPGSAYVFTFSTGAWLESETRQLRRGEMSQACQVPNRINAHLRSPTAQRSSRRRSHLGCATVWSAVVHRSRRRNRERDWARELLQTLTTSSHLPPALGDSEATSFWKRGSFRSGSNIGSSRSSAGVSGTCEASGAQ
jgi:hypothetical protein